MENESKRRALNATPECRKMYSKVLTACLVPSLRLRVTGAQNEVDPVDERLTLNVLPGGVAHSSALLASLGTSQCRCRQ